VLIVQQQINERERESGVFLWGFFTFVADKGSHQGIELTLEQIIMPIKQQQSILEP
jgi:hypothetical protein